MHSNNGCKSAKWLLVTLLTLCVTFCAVGETACWNMFERRLGMFVHWGIYSVGEWHEQEEMRRGMERCWGQTPTERTITADNQRISRKKRL